MTTALPAQTQSDIANQADWRENFLQRILVISAVLGIFALFSAVLSTDNLIIQSVYIGAYTILVGSILIRLPYIVKANIFAVLPLILGISSLLEIGIRGDSLFFLLAYVTFSTLLVGPRGGAISILVSELVIIGMGYLVLADYYKLSNSLALEASLADWLTAGVSHLMISLVALSGLRILQAGFDQARARIEDMLETLRGSQTELESRVAERTKELAHKTNQMAASTFVAHQTASIQNLNTLLDSTVDLISKQFGYYHVAIFLINPRGDYATLQAASLESGKQIVERGYRLRIGAEGIVGFVAAEKKPHIAQDVRDDALYIDSPELPDTRSELALPLIVRNKVIGVLDMQSSELQGFQYDDIEMFQTLADQIAISIENARLLTESQITISQLEVASSESTRRDWQTETAVQNPAFHYSATGVQAVEKATPPKGKNVLNIPLVLRGQKIGKISLQRKDEFQNWTVQEETVANKVATQTALALENIRLVEHTRQRANREQAIAKVAARIRETLDLDTVLRTSARELQNALNLEEAEIRLIPQDNPDDRKESQETKSS